MVVGDVDVDKLREFRQTSAKIGSNSNKFARGNTFTRIWVRDLELATRLNSYFHWHLLVPSKLQSFNLLIKLLLDHSNCASRDFIVKNLSIKHCLRENFPTDCGI